MPEPATIFGVKAGTAAAMSAGSIVAGLLMQGQPAHVRLIAGVAGCAASFIFTPILTPLAFKGWAMVYGSLGVPTAELSRDSVAGFVGFASALVGIDLCRAVIDRTKSGLKMIRWPWKKGSRGD